MTPQGDEFRRRASDGRSPDSMDEEILELIRRAGDNDQKAHLIVLYRMATLLTNVINRLELQESATETHRDLVIKASGAWRAMAIGMVAFVGLIGVIGTLAGYIWYGQRDDIQAVRDDIKKIIHDDGERDLRLGRLETNTPISREADKRLTILENNMKDTIGNQIDNRQRLGELERAFNRVLEHRAKGK